ncbi:UDP-glucose 4-epimerase GalE [Rhodobacteraceae bacterium XHP0102]|nr:UDP-glucose 4-epimerase GalE [Rhodobacteraceae bacterium XHP0102]
MGNAILVTGGAGYIGSHIVVAVHEAGYTPVILDNFNNARRDVPARLARIMGSAPQVIEGDIRDAACLDRVFAAQDFAGVIHLAAHKAVGESVTMPLAYFDNNVGGFLTLLGAMGRAGCKRLVFSSSATVYGAADETPTSETAPRSAMNPYGRTKIICEEILEDLCASDPEWAVGVLRYFNPAGAHGSGLIGEDPADIPNNLMPYIAKVATGELAKISVFGDDYDTPDGTGVRDYIHVEDLAEGHLLSLAHLQKGKGHLVNLGTGRGYSVLEMIAAYQRASNRHLPYEIVARREGDVAVCCAKTEKARDLLGFEAKRGLDDMCASSWAWMQNQTQLRG